MLFELSVIIVSVSLFLILKKINKNILRRVGIVFIGVLLFEYFTQALWLNNKLESWAYLYLDVSWIITLGWTAIIVVSMTIIDLYFPKSLERRRFLLYLVLVTIAGIIGEGIVLKLGIREYSSAVQRMLTGITIWNVPIEAIYYIPVFMTLVISFLRYWEISLDKNWRGKKK